MTKRKKEVRPQLRQGEEVIWTGSPCEDKLYGKIDRVLLPVSLVALAGSALYAVLMIASIARFGFSMHHVVQFILLLFAGGFAVYSYFVRFSNKRQMKADLIYGITNYGRVFIRDQAAREIYEFEGDQLKDAWISEIDKNGVGTIYFGRRDLSNLLDNTGMTIFGPDEGVHAAMYDVENCKKVFKVIKRKQA